MRAVTTVLLGAVLLLAGCSAPLDLSYGTTQAGTTSLNGLRILHAELADHWQLRRAWRLNDRLDQEDMGLLIHVAQDDEPTDAKTIAWLKDWLEAQPGRQLLLIARDGGVGPVVLPAWIAQARHEAASQEPLRAAALEALADRLEHRLAEESGAEERSSPRLGLGKDLTFTKAPRSVVSSLRGVGVNGLPPTTLRLGMYPSGEDLETLVAARTSTGIHPLVGALPVGESRVVVVANATALVDGAQPDPRARALLAALVADLQAHDGNHRQAAWVSSLAVADGEPDLDLLHLLFATPPVSCVAWHLAACLLIFLLWHGRHLGRRQDPPSTARQRFHAHVAALAGHLAQGRHASRCAAEISKWRGHPAPPPTLAADPAAAVAWLNDHHRPKDPP